ncbi:MAG TPA: Ig-like domain-containing protein [Clostridia bacterium]|nr:Ig-like domain-containing protein [Clostridia bacterium]
MLSAQMSRVKRIGKRVFRVALCAMLVLQTLWVPNAALAASSAFYFRGYGVENINSTTLSYATNGASVSGRNVTISSSAGEGEAIGLVNLDETNHDISKSVDLGGLEIDFSTVSNVTLEGEAGADNDVPTATILFCSDANIGSVISSVTLTKADGTIAGSETLSSGAKIPNGTRSIFLSLKGTSRTGNNTVSFTDTSLMIHDAGAPSCSADYYKDWTNQNVTVTITAADSDAGLEAIYVNDGRVSETSPYTFTISANNTSFSAYAMDLAGKKSDIVSGTVDHIDKTTPAAPSSVPLSSSTWTNADVFVLMPALSAATGAPERYVYQIGAAAWADLPDGFSISAEGNTTIRVAVADAAGNRSSSAQATAKIDKSKPTISNATITSGSSSAKVDVTATDVGLSGIQKFSYAAGEQTADYFTTSGTPISGGSFTVGVGGTYTIFASDYAGNTTLKTISITTAPTFDAVSNVTMDEDETRNIPLSISDAESSRSQLIIQVTTSDDALLKTVKLNQSDEAISLDITPAANQSGGPVTVTVSVEDPSGQKVTRQFTVTVNAVNDNPTAQDDNDITLAEDSAVEIDVLANDGDQADGDAISISTVGDAAHGTTLIVLGKIRYTPNENYAGTDSFTYEITDGKGGTAQAIVRVTVNQVNDAPKAANDTALTKEDTFVDINALDNDSDVDRATDTTETISLYSCENGAHGTAVILNGMIRYTPETNFNGTDTFTYTIQDKAGLTAEATVTVTVSPESDAPWFVGLSDEYTINEDAKNHEIAFEIHDVETPQDSLMLQAATLDGDLIDQSGVVLSGLGGSGASVKLLLTPQANMHGDVPIKLTLGDGFDTVEKTITVHILNVNDAPRAGSETLNFTEDAPYFDISIATLLSNDSDIDGDAIFFDGLASDPFSGTIARLNDTTLRYTPAKDFDGTTSFTYYISDGTARTLATCTLEAIGVNDAPHITITPEQISGSEDAPIVIPFQISDNESAAADLSVFAASNDDNIVTTDGITIVNNGDGTGTVQILPAADANGSPKITLTVSDGEAQANDSVTLVIAPVQDAPVAEDDLIYVHYTTSRSFSVLVNDHDVDADPLTVKEYAASLPGTLTFDPETQMFRYVPSIGETGIVTFTYTVTDGTGTDTATVTLDVVSETHNPVITAIDSRYVSEDATLSNIAFSVSDEDIGDTVSVRVTSGNKTLLPEDAEHIVLTNLGGGNYSLSLTPGADQSGTTSVTLTATDKAGLTDSTTFSLHVIAQNDVPVAVNDTLSVDEDGALTLSLLGNDSDPDGDTIWLSSISAPAHGYIERTGNTYTYYPYANWSGSETLTYRISDGRASAQATVSITVNPVNDAPIAWDDWLKVPNSVGNESANINVIGNDYDADGDAVHTYQIVTAPKYGTVEILPGGTITYVRNQLSPEGNGADSFVYSIIDRETATGDYRTANATVHIGVEFTSTLNAHYQYVTCYEDDKPFTIDLPVSNPTPVNYTLTVNTTTTLGTFEVVDNNTVRFTPAPDQYGYAEITYTVEQVGGGEKDTGTIYLRVYPVNDLPEITSAPASVTMDEDTSGGTTFDVLFHDVDCANEYLYFYVYTKDTSTSAPIPFQVSYSTTPIEGGKRITINTAENVNGTGTIVVGVSDGMTYVEKEIALSVTPVDDAPVVGSVSKTINEDSSVVFASPGSDSEVDGDTITEVIDPAHGPQHGTATLRANHTICYVPNANYYGTDSFYVIVADQTEAKLFSAALVTITIRPVNDAPEISDLDYYQTTLEDVPADVTLSVSDVDNILTASSHYTLTSADQKLVKNENITISNVSGTGMVIHVVPEANAYGTVKINIVASDGSLSATGAFLLKIVPVNDPPVAADDTASVDEVVSTGAEAKPPKTLKTIDLLANDSDVEDVKPSVVSISDVVNATVTNLGGGKVLVSADGDSSQTVTFTYTVMDRAGATASAHVTLTINPVNDPPRAKNDSITIFEDATPLIDALYNDTDPEGDTLSIAAVGNPAHGSASISDNKINYVPNQDYYGTDSFTYTVSDGNGGTANATVSVTIKPVNDAPTVNKHSTTSGDWVMQEDTPASFNFVVADAESATSNLIIKITSLDETLVKTTQIALTTNAAGYKTLTVTPAANAHGTLELKIWVSDGLLTGQAIYTLEIISVNDAPVVTVPLQTTKEDTALHASAFATDVDGDSVTFAKQTDPAHGTVTVYPDGSFDYMPTKDYNGEDSFVILANDGQPSNNIGYATVYITVKPEGDPPTAQDDSITIDEDIATVIPVLSNDSDQDVPYGDKISLLRVTTPAHGTAVISEGGILYTPNANYNGSDTFGYTITDRDGKTDTATVSITIRPVNDKPAGGDDTATVLEDHFVTMDVTANDDVDETTNPDLEDVTIVTVDKPAHGTAVISEDKKSITYTPDANWFGPEGEPEVFYYTAKDSSNQTERFAIRVTVTSVNDLPVISPDLPNVTTQEDTRTDAITFTVSDIETAAGSLIVTATHLNGVLLPPITVSPDANGNCSFTVLPNLNKVGDAVITIKVTDADGGQTSDTFTLKVSPVNDLPKAGNDAFTVAENETYTADVLANDDVDILAGNGDDTLTLLTIATPQYGTATIVDNKLYYVPKTDRDTTVSYQDVFTYTMKDASGATCTPTVTVTVTPVNDPPTISSIANVTGVLEDAPDGTGAISFHVTDEEDDDNTLFVTAQSDNLALFLLSNITIDNPVDDATGTLRTVKVVPAANQFGSGEITLTVRDAQGLTATTSFTVTIDSVNDEPNNGDKSFTVVEDVEKQLDVLKDIDPDYATTPEYYSITAIATNPSHGTVRIAEDKKSVYYTTAQDSNEPDSFQYTVYDAYGKASYTFTVSITVTPVNDAPYIVYHGQSTYTIFEGTQQNDIPFEVHDVDNVAYAGGTEPVEVTLTAKSSNTVLLVGGIKIDTLSGYDRNIDLKPNGKWNGNTTVTITATDPDGLKATASFVLVVNNVNDIPVAVNDTGTILEDVTTTINVLGNDTDDDLQTNPDTEKLTVKTVTSSDPNATITRASEGLGVVVVPKANYNGPLSFTYTVVDSQNAESNAATVNLTVQQVNDAPVAGADSDTTDEDTAVVIPVLVNDSDIDMDKDLNAHYGDESISVDLTGGGLIAPTHGTISTDGLTITYTPAKDYNGPDSFEYYCSDSEVKTRASVSIVVYQVNDAPKAVADTASTNEDTPKDGIDVLNNDTDVDTGSTLNKNVLHSKTDFRITATSLTNSAHGSVDIINNKLKFTPASNWFGTEVVNYTMIDGHGGTANGTLTMTVNSVNDLPVYTTAPVDLELTEDGADGTMDIVVDDVETAKNDLSVTVTNSTNPTLIATSDVTVTTGTNGTRTITINPKLNQNGTAMITLLLKDANGGETVKQFTVTVNSVNDAPIAADKTLNINEDAALQTIDKWLLVSDVDVETNTDELTLTITTAAQHGTAAVDASGNVTYVPGKDFNGVDTFVYTVKDKDGLTDTGTFTVNIAQVNDAPIPDDDSATTDEDTAVVIDALDGDYDVDKVANLNAHPENESLSIDLTGGGLKAPSHGTISTDGLTITYTPSKDYNGTDTFEYNCFDGDVKVTAEVTVTIKQVNDASVANPDAATIDEDHETDYIKVLDNDTDVDIDPTLNQDEALLRSMFYISAASLLDPTVGALDWTVDSIHFKPKANWYGEAKIFYTMKDGYGSGASTALIVTVNSVNDLPVYTTAPVNLELTEDGADGTMNIVVDDVETAKNDLSVTVTNSTNPTLIATSDVTVTTGTNGTRTITINPKLNQNGTAMITLLLKDANGGETVKQFTVTVNSVNDAPIAADKTLNINEDAALQTIDKWLLVSDVDVETNTDELTLTITTAAQHGTAAVDASGNVSYVPGKDFNGVDTFVYTVKDKDGLTDTGTFTVNIAQVNDAPVPDDDSATTDEDTAIVIDALDGDYDVDKVAHLNAHPENESLSIDLTGGELKAPSHGTISTDGLTITYTPSKDYNGTDTFEYNCYDSDVKVKAEVTVTIKQVNDAPVANADTATTNEDYATTPIDVLANDTDVDTGSTLNQNVIHSRDTFTVTEATVTNASHGSVKIVDNKLIFTPADNWFGEEVIQYTLSDGHGGSASNTLTVTVNSVNDLPYLNMAPGYQYLTEDGADGASLFYVNDVETNPSLVNVTLKSCSNTTLIPLSAITLEHKGGAGRLITVNPADNLFGDALITLVLEDEDGGKTEVTMEVHVSSVNDAPIAADKTLNIGEDAPLQTIDKWLLVSDVDVETNADELTLTITTAAQHGTAAVDASGNVSYVPGKDFNGVDTFVYTVKDKDGLTDTGTFTVNIAQVNDAPIPDDDSATTDEDTAVVIDALDGDYDVDKVANLNAHPENESLSIDLTGGGLKAPSHGTISTDGLTITYTPSKDYNGSDTFEYYCFDGDVKVKAEVTVTIKQVNDAPVANADSTSTPEDTAVRYNVLANDSDVDTDEALNKDVLHSKGDFTIEDCSFYGGSNGSLEIDGALIRYTPATNFHGTQIIQYVLRDGHGKTSTGTLTIMVDSENDTPVARPDSMSADEDHDASVNVLTNDTDGDDGDTKTFVGFLEPTSGLPGIFTTDANGEITFTPEKDYNGTFDITYQMRDAAGATSSAKLTVTILPVNDAPVAQDDAALTNEDTAKVIDVASLILDADIDTNGDTLEVSVAKTGEPAHGSISISGTKITYTPDADFNGLDEITYTVTDSKGATDTGKLSITVSAVNDAPKAANDTKLMDEDTAANIYVLMNDSDVDTDEILNLVPSAAPYILSVTNGAHGTTDTDGMKIVYTPDANYNGTDTITYVLTDGLLTAEASVSISIMQVNDGIQAEDDTAKTNDEDKVSVDVLKNDWDVDTDSALNGDELHLRTSFAIAAVSKPAHGKAEIVSGKIDYTPDDRFAGVDSFTYTVTDGYGTTAIGTVNVTVISVNDPPVILTVTSPKDGDRAGTGSTVNVNWTGFDIDGDALTYTLEYYDGKVWHEIAKDLTDTTYVFAIPETLASTDGLKFRVNVRDSEFTSDYGYSGAMKVDKDAPKGTVVTMQTADGRAYTAGTWTNQTVTVVASSAADASKVTYYYDMDSGTSAAATGMDVVAGVHTVNIKAVDEYGNTTVVGGYLARVDKQQPAVPEIRESISGGSVVLMLTLQTDPGGSGNDRLTLPDGTTVRATGSPTFATTKNGTYSFTLTDVAGNRRTFTYMVGTVDLSKPTITLASGAYRTGTATKDPISATLTFADTESDIVTRGYQLSQSSTPSGAYRTYDGALKLSDPGKYYIHAYAKNAFGLTAYETFGPFILEAAEQPAASPIPVPTSGDVVVTKEDVEEIPGDTVKIRLPGKEWSETLTLEDVGPGTYVIEAMDADGNIRNVEVRVTMRDIFARSIRSAGDNVTLAAIAAIAALAGILFLLLLAGHNITVVVVGTRGSAQQKLRTLRRMKFRKKELIVKLDDKHLSGGEFCNLKLAKTLSKQMRKNTIIVTMRGVEVLREEIPADFDEAFQRTIRIER